jgi:hypothetical protein
MISLETEKSTARMGEDRLYRYAGLICLLEAWLWVWLESSNLKLNNFEYSQIDQCCGFL